MAPMVGLHCFLAGMYLRRSFKLQNTLSESYEAEGITAGRVPYKMVFEFEALIPRPRYLSLKHQTDG